MEIQRAVGVSANISHLNSILALKKRRDFDGWLAHLKEALQIQLKSMQGQAITYGFPFETLNLTIPFFHDLVLITIFYSILNLFCRSFEIILRVIFGSSCLQVKFYYLCNGFRVNLR